MIDGIFKNLFIAPFSDRIGLFRSYIPGENIQGKVCIFAIAGLDELSKLQLQEVVIGCIIKANKKTEAILNADVFDQLRKKGAFKLELEEVDHVEITGVLHHVFKKYDYFVN
ncbi:hypothetical protein MASR1M45_05960 [Candidatus Kapaibacterium sp.]